MAKRGKFKFRKTDHVGCADAEEDSSYLKECFVDTGDLHILKDCGDARRVVIGRTGVGKSALILKLMETVDRVIEIKPESLSLAYISNSTILNFFSELGVRLDVFFKLLWRHVFTVEILKYHFKIDSEEAKKNFALKLLSIFRDKKHEKALEYLEKWGKSFWEETEYRIKEVTTKLEDNLKAAVGLLVPPASIGVDTLQCISKEQKDEILYRAQHVVNEVQIRQLTDIIEMIDDVLTDPQKRYYIVIDRLDEDWIDERLRYKLIRALVETVKDFRKVKNVKIIIAIRQDLLQRVFRTTRDTGFQEEKYESLYLPVQWTTKNLRTILDKRVNYLVKQRYTSRTVTCADVLPRPIRKQDAVDYMLDRTMLRPRDIILFFNYCIQNAIDSPVVNPKMVLEAENEYSRTRFRSLSDEWFADYPNLNDFALILKLKPPHFKLPVVEESEIENFCLDYAVKDHEKDDILSEYAQKVANGDFRADDFLKVMLQIFFQVGLVGLKLEAYDKTIWATARLRQISCNEIDDQTGVSIHPAFYRALGIRTR